MSSGSKQTESEPSELIPAGPPVDAEPVEVDEDPSASEEFLTDEVRVLVERAQGGEADALNELFTRYHDHLVDLARRRLGPRLRAKEEADDLAQTTFREATRDFRQYRYRGETSLMSWLVRILQNKIRDKAEYYAAGKRDVSKERALEDTYSGSTEADPVRREPESADLSVTRIVQRKEEFAVLRQALEELSADHRKAITLVFFEGLTLREAGRRMDGRSEDAVRMLLRRAEARLGELTRARLG
jgi:RNA polymerase sigma-70 factor (ECF subfamily)